MQDRFKFRVWNKARQCFMTEKEIFICGNGELVLIDEALSRTWVKDNPNYKVSFCTGRKDKNGKLIYDGDLLKPLSEDDERVEVVWNEEKARFGLMIQWTDYCYWNGLYEETKTGRDYYELDDYYAEDFAVIGNVYENPELLEVKND